MDAWVNAWKQVPQRTLGQLALLVLAGALGAGFYRYQAPEKAPAGPASPIISYRVSPRRQRIQLYWQDEQGRPFRSLGNLRDWLARRGEQLIFATNGGMFQESRRPVGLLMQAGRIITPLDTGRGPGNFYLPPNGVFFISRTRTAGISATADFTARHVAYATQSGPLLVIRGAINPAFRPGSTNLNIRNGVGILPGGDVVFAMSKQEINFYDFAAYFRRLGCRQALYLDGFVSRTYLPAQDWTQTDGDFGVIIGVTMGAGASAVPAP